MNEPIALVETSFFPNLAKRLSCFPNVSFGKQVYVRGRVQDLKMDIPSVAIVGTRNPSAYGLRFVEEFVGSLAKSGRWNVVSGGAFGIDGAAHVAALKFGLPTQAWVVGPVENPSPTSHQALFNRIEKSSGCAVLVPDLLQPDPISSDGSKFRFHKSAWVRRNLWVAGSVDALVVVEARVGSGTQTTVQAALDLGVSVYCVPGNIYSPASQGTNLMISLGHGEPVLSVRNLVQALVDAGHPNFYNRTQREKSDDVSGGKPRSVEDWVHAQIVASEGLSLQELLVLAQRFGWSVNDVMRAIEVGFGTGRWQVMGNRLEVGAGCQPE